jgi:hypothetical protein
MNLLQSLKNLLPNKTQDKIRQDMTLTTWFDGRIKPVHIGVYERRSTFGFAHYSYWNGKKWKLISSTPDEAFKVRVDCHNSYFQTLEWRGVCQ